jgi:transposase InsO family protein
MAIDYRKLNQLTSPNRWPLPHIDELLEQVREAKVFTLLDLKSGYHQIKLSQEDIPKTAFITPVGLFEFRVLPFGLCNAPAVFTRYMTKVLGPLLGISVVVYLDDILVFSKTPGEHLGHLEQVFKILEQHKLYANGKKCSLNREELKYLGHIVGHGCLKVDPVKIAAVSDWPEPTNPKELQSFLGLANYFSRFMQGFSTLAAPLSTLAAQTAPKTKRATGTPYDSTTWTAQHKTAFEGIKRALCSAPVLHMADPTLPYRIISDASNLGTGAVLMQQDHPVAYLSHKFSPTEARYHTGEQELLGVILALKAWRCYVQGCPGGLTLVTDHHPLTYLTTQPHLSPKQVRWSQYLSSFMPFKWEFIPGRLNVADPLSRHPAFELRALTVTHLPPRDPVPSAIRQLIVHGYTTDSFFSNPSATMGLQKSLDGLWRGGGAITGSGFTAALTAFSSQRPSASQVVVPDDQQLKRDLLHEFHDSSSAGHPGIDRTLELLARYYWWPGMMLDVHEHVRTCTSCQRSKALQRRIPPLVPLSVPVARWDSISLDFIIKLPRSGRYDSILVIVDRLTKFAILVPTSEHITAAKAAALFVNRAASRFGLPSEIVTDRDSKFTGVFWPEVLRLFGTKHAMSTAYHPQTDGQTERMNRLLEETLRHYISQNQKDWPSLLPMAEFAINNAWSSTVQASPFYLMHGQHPRVPGALLGDTQQAPSRALSFTASMRDAILSAQRCMSKAHDRMRSRFTGKPIAYAVGQLVLLSRKNLKVDKGLSDKLSRKFEGPFPISRIIEKGGQVVAVELQLPRDYLIHPVVGVSLIKPFHERATPPALTTPLVQHLARP